MVGKNQDYVCIHGYSHILWDKVSAEWLSKYQLGCTIILAGIVWTIMNKINKNNLIYVNIQQPSVSACSSTMKTTKTIEPYGYPFYALNQLKALNGKSILIELWG